LADDKNLAFLISASVFIVLGAFFIIAGVVAPAGSTQFQYQYPSLSWVVTMTPSGVGILGTGPQAQQLQIVIGIIFLVIAIILYRRA
jgi:uncharacterized membrane protein